MFLALDSVFNQCSVALVSANGDVLNHDTQTGKRAQTQKILPMIESILIRAQADLNSLDALIFNRGPGAFSGIRINTAVVQALSVAHDLPCVGISSLQVLAQAAFEQYDITACYATHDAKMKQVYMGRFALKSAIMHPDTDQEAAESLVDYYEQTPLSLPLVGDGATLLHAHQNQRIVTQLDLNACITARLGIDSFNRHGGVTAEHALPVYLRNHAWKTLKEQGRA